MSRCPAEPRTSLQLLFDRTYGRIVWGRILSASAFWGQTLLVGTLVYSATGSATWVGVVGAAQFVPQMVLGLTMGKMADTYGPKPQILVGASLCATGSFALALSVLLLGPDRGPAFAVVAVVVAAFCGIGFSMTGPALESIAPKLVSPAELPSAVALNHVPAALGRTLGPAGGALLATAATPSVALCIAGSASLLFTAMIATVELPKVALGSVPADDLRIGSALQTVWRDRSLRRMLLGVAVVGFSAEPALTLAPAIADLFDAGVGGAGRIASAFGIGSLAGVLLHKLVQARVPAQREGWLALMVLGASVGAVAVSPTLVVSSWAMAAAGACMLMAVTGFSVAVQANCPPAILGRVMALWLVAFVGVRPLAGLAQGIVADHLSTRTALIGTAVLVVSVAAAGNWRMGVAGARRGSTVPAGARRALARRRTPRPLAASDTVEGMMVP